MDKKLIGRILAALLASVSVFAFAACDTDGGETAGSGNGTENTGTIDNGTTDNDKKDPVVKPDQPVIPTVPAGAVQITKAAGDLESAYATWNKVDGGMGYKV